MKKQAWRVAVIFSVLSSLGLATTSQGFFIDKQKTLKVSAKAQTRVTIRLQDADSGAAGKGYTLPDTEIGTLVQHRNLGLIEIDHDLKNLVGELDILYPFRALGIKVKYHMVGRFLYEGIYDYGPTIFQDVRDADKENIDTFKQSYDLWECYMDLSRGPFFVRAGRQNLAWGETDLFRLLDYINPLDNTFGGPFEDLDDRRIPLWMLRASYNLGNVGPVSSLALEGFVVPGNLDPRVAPFSPFGTPYAVPLPEEFFPFIRIVTPDKKGASSRWGVRVQGLVKENVNISLAHYKTFLDLPVLRSVVDQGRLLWMGGTSMLASLDALALEGSFPDVQITGGSMSFWESHLNVIVRSEVAWFWDEPVFIPEQNLATLYGSTFPLPDPVLDSVADLFGIDIRDLGLNGLPLNPQSGSIPEKDILRYMLGLDKQIWIRPLNKTSMFFLSMQYFGQWVPDYDDRMRQAAPMYPDFLVFPVLKETEHVFTAILTTNYRKGSITPQFAMAYDVRGAWLIQPSVNLVHEPFRLMIQYSTIEGNFTNFGVFRDRDQISFIFNYMLN